MRLTNSRFISLLTLAASATLALGCDQAVTHTQGDSASPAGLEAGVDQDTLTVSEINTFFAQDAVEVTLYPVERPEAIQGFFEIPLTDARVQVEVLFHKETVTEQHLAEALREGKRQVTIKLSEIAGFQTHSSLGDHIVDRAEVGEFLIDEEVPAICGTRKTTAVAIIEHEGDEVAVMLALHLLPLEGFPGALNDGEHLTAMGGKGGPMSKIAGEPKSKTVGGGQSQGDVLQTKPQAAADPIPVQNTDCGDDWTFFGAPDCHDSCQRICTQVVDQSTGGGVGGVKVGPVYCVVIAGGTTRCFARYQLKLNCQVDWGFFTNSCECAPCPKI